MDLLATPDEILREMLGGLDDEAADAKRREFEAKARAQLRRSS